MIEASVRMIDAEFTEQLRQTAALAFTGHSTHINGATAHCACCNSSLTWAACASRRSFFSLV